jgi:hypothetical protein
LQKSPADTRRYNVLLRKSEAEAPFDFTKELKFFAGFCMIRANDPADSRPYHRHAGKDSRNKRLPALRI